MITLYHQGVYLFEGCRLIPEDQADFLETQGVTRQEMEEAWKGTIAYSILEEHNRSGDMKHLKLRFDSMTSHDITYVGVIQTARASGMKEFPLPYVLTNCHNSLCAVGGTINEDDHRFGLSACKKYGGIFVPPHLAVMHQYMREQMAGCGKMILGSDSHTRYGALGTLGIGEGGGELVKQLLNDTYDIPYPKIVAVYLEGEPKPWVGPQDIALAMIGAVFKNGYVKNTIVEFVGPGVSSLTTDFRNGIDVMTTETTCLSSIWRTDEDTKAYLAARGRAEEYRELEPKALAFYDGCISIDLGTISPMIALPFHPSNVYEIEELNANLDDILGQVEKRAAEIADGRACLTLRDKVKDGCLQVQQAVIAGCAGGTFTNLMKAAQILKGRSCGYSGFTLNIYPSSQPVYQELIQKGAVQDLINAGAILRTAFCGPCFGAGDTPGNNSLSIRHTTRNFPNREGSKPGQGQMAAVALMDARSIAATAANGGKLTSAKTFGDVGPVGDEQFDERVYKSRVYAGFGRPEPEQPLIYGPNIKDWPEMGPLTDNILLKICSRIMDEVTTTDELIPSGETSSYRSNPMGLAEFTLSRRDPGYVGRAKEVKCLEELRRSGENPEDKDEKLAQVFETIKMRWPEVNPLKTELGSVLYAVKPGDGSAREQAASCQRVLGGLANICREYATKRYCSNVVNWGMIPFCMKEEPRFEVGDYLFVPGIRQFFSADGAELAAYMVKDGKLQEIHLTVPALTKEEREIIKAGCLINYNRNREQRLHE